jgi:AraC-like DNA-binding protein
MLIFSDAAIVDISYGCGIESISYFYKLFREHHGLSPAKYRRKAEQDDISSTDAPVVPFRGDYFTPDGLPLTGM